MYNQLLRFATLCYFLLASGMLMAQQATDFYDTKVIQQIDINFEQDNWPYLLDSLRFNGEGVLLGDVTINGKRLEDAGIRYAASRSFQPGNMRNSLEVLLNYIDNNAAYQGYQTLRLSSALRDPSMVREVLGYEIARQYMPAPLANYARVSVNGKLYGLFVNIEAIDQGFIQRKLNESGGTLYRSIVQPDKKADAGCRTNQYGTLQVDNSADCYRAGFSLVYGSGYESLLNLAKTLAEKPGEIGNVLQADRTLWMLAFNNALLNLNSYSGQYSSNYYLYRSKTGQFTPIISDLNLAFGSYKNIGTGSDLKASAMIQLDPMLHSTFAERPLISKLLSNEQYRKMYVSHLMTINQQQLADGQYIKRAKELQQLIRAELAKDAGWYYTLAEFDQSLSVTIGKKTKIPGLQEVMDSRSDYLRKHPELSVVPPHISEVRVKTREKLSAVQLETFRITARVDEFPKRVRIYYRFYDNEPFREMAMLDDGQQEDGAAGDGVFGVNITPVRGARQLRYYIVAENVRMLSFDPPRYMYELHETSLDEINR
jgi:spore coat protein CotH